MILDSTTEKITLVLAGATTTSPGDCDANWTTSDPSGSPTFGAGSNSPQTNGTTSVDLVPVPTSATMRVSVEEISVVNRDTQPMTVTIRKTDTTGPTHRVVFGPCTIQVGEKIQFKRDTGWNVFTVTGAVKVTAVQSTVEPGYIDGLKLRRVGARDLTVTTGSAYIPSVGANVNVTSDIAKTSITFTASVFNHIYLFLNSGIPDYEVSTTAPSTPYNGVARTKTGDPSRRYLGSVLVDGSSNMYGFLHDGLDIAYQANVFPAPFQVLANGAATVGTNVACSGVVPVSGRIASAILSNNDPSVRCDIWNSEGAQAMLFVNGGNSNFARVALNSSQQLIYAYASAPGGNNMNIRITGYQLER